MKAILLILILAINGCGFYVYYAIQLQQIHYDMRKVLQGKPDSELELLILTPEEFDEARVEEYEVKVNGKMYDIARIKISGNHVEVFCLHDEKEDNFITFFAELVGKPMKDQSSLPSEIILFITMNFIFSTENICFSNISSDIIKVSFYQPSIVGFRLEIVTPPPKFS
jgi:hypothetical protein